MAILSDDEKSDEEIGPLSYNYFNIRTEPLIFNVDKELLNSKTAINATTIGEP